ncbi:MAG: N-acetyl sugar amidotransferase [Candidatus Zixiibacteriota bacterium]|nr:MAG: N-acetyl sugar amidotransferase [candidate division Zixibacteria bacterium]
MTQVCKRCIYDESIPKISFDEEGICSYCRLHEQMDREYPTGEEGRKILNTIVEKMKLQGRKKSYDVVIGVSGGCDSSYMLCLARELGLRPLAAHFDNTWNSKIAVENIRTMTEKLDIDLFTHVVDNKEYTDLFRSFFRASVPEIDTPSDISLATTHYLAAEKYGVKYIWEGHSFRTEGITPPGWVYMDAKYVQTIHRTFGSVKMKTLPNLWMRRWLKWIVVDKVRKIRPLYYIDYNKEETKKFLSKKFGWQWYGGHHMENRTASFTNNYYLPRKFSINLRICEYSALIRSGQMSRDEALARVRQPRPVDPEIIAEIKKRLGFSEEEFEQIMNAPRKTYRDYKTYKRRFERMRPFFWLMYKMDLVPKSFYVKYTARDN